MDNLLIFLSIILLGFMYVILFIEKTINKNIPGLTYFSNSFLSGFIFSCYLIIQPIISEVLSIIIFQSCNFFLAFFTFLGARDYVGKNKFPILKITLIYIPILLFSLLFTLIIPNQLIRFIFASFISGFLFLLSAKTIAQGGIVEFPKRYLFAFACLFHSLFLFIRPIILNLDFVGKFYFFHVISFSQIIIFESVVSLVILSLGVLSLTNEHILIELKRLAELDSLTNVFNRRSFMLIFNKIFNQIQRNKSELSLLAVDLDFFKKINDTYGHCTGDIALCHFISIANNNLRDGDIIGRLGGEEFAILLPNTSIEHANQISNRLLLTLSQTPLIYEKNTIHITASIGLTNCANGETINIFLKRADNAMYLAKNNGRNRVEIIT